MSPLDENMVENRLQSEVDAGIDEVGTIGPEFYLALFKAMRAHRARLVALEAASVTVQVVANAGALPASAKANEFFRVQGDSALYIGNGLTKPLTKLVPV